MDLTLLAAIQKMQKNSARPSYRVDSYRVPSSVEQFRDVFSDFLASQSARSFATAIYNRMIEFDKDLDSDHEVGVKLVTFGKEFTFHVVELGYTEPNLIIFRGFADNGSPVDLVQHVCQISFLLMRVKRLSPDVRKKPIGFVVSDEVDA